MIPSGIVTCLPDGDVDDLVAVVEVLVQEHLPAFAVRPQHVVELRAIFGRRATIGVWGVTEFEELTHADEAGAEFVIADVVDRDMAAYCEHKDIAILGTAMTPLEVRALLELGVDGACLWPADVVGHAMAAHLERVGLAERVIPMGGVGAYAAGEWMKHGSPAACVDHTLLGDAPTGGDLGKLRDRCASFRKSSRQAVEHRGQVANAEQPLRQ